MASFFDFPRMSSFKKRRPAKKPFPIRRSRKHLGSTRKKFSAATRRPFKSRTFKRRKTNTLKALSKRVTKMAKSVDQGLSYLTVRKLTLGSFSTVASEQLTQSVDVANQGLLNESLSNVSYFDSSTNSIVSIDASDPASTYQRDYQLQAHIVKVTLTNTQTTPVTLKAHLMRPAHDTSVSPVSAYLAGLFDNNNLDKDNVQTKWSDSIALGEMWKSITGETTTLQAGQSLVLRTNLGAMKYSIQTAELDSLSYRRDEHPCALMVTIQGPLARDSINTEFGYGPATLQYEIQNIYKWEYDGGLSMRRTRTFANGITPVFTNEAVISQKPLAGPQAINSGSF